MAQCLELNPIEIVGTTALVIEGSGEGSEGSGGGKSGTTVSYYEIRYVSKKTEFMLLLYHGIYITFRYIPDLLRYATTLLLVH